MKVINRIMPKQHNSKQMKKLFRDLEQIGFTISKKTKSGVVKILPPESIAGPIYCSHMTESAYHAIRRDFKKMYGLDIITGTFSVPENKQLKSKISIKI